LGKFNNGPERNFPEKIILLYFEFIGGILLKISHYYLKECPTGFDPLTGQKKESKRRNWKRI
jgi:hypothetical protein